MKTKTVFLLPFACMIAIVAFACVAAKQASPYYAEQDACVQNNSTKKTIDDCRCGVMVKYGRTCPSSDGLQSADGGR